MILTLAPASAGARAAQALACSLVAVGDCNGQVWCNECSRGSLSGTIARGMNGTCMDNYPYTAADALAALDGLIQLFGEPIGKGERGGQLVQRTSIAPVSRVKDGRDCTAALYDAQKRADCNCAMIAGNRSARSGACRKGHYCR